LASLFPGDGSFHFQGRSGVTCLVYVVADSSLVMSDFRKIREDYLMALGIELEAGSTDSSTLEKTE
jgi:hypothetical protein